VGRQRAERAASGHGAAHGDGVHDDAGPDGDGKAQPEGGPQHEGEDEEHDGQRAAEDQDAAERRGGQQPDGFRSPARRDPGPQAAEEQEERSDGQHPDRVAHPPVEPGEGNVVAGDVPADGEGAGPDGRGHEAAGEGAEEHQRHDVVEPAQGPVEAGPAEEDDGHHRGQALAGGRCQRHRGGDVMRERLEKADDQYGRPRPDAEAQQAGHRDARRWPDGGDTGHGGQLGARLGGDGVGRSEEEQRAEGCRPARERPGSTDRPDALRKVCAHGW
jgi:hypothetical protein